MHYFTSYTYVSALSGIKISEIKEKKQKNVIAGMSCNDEGFFASFC